MAVTRRQLPGSVHVIDLRQEPHGFINGIPVSWYGPQNQTYASLSPGEIERLEVLWLSDIGAQPMVQLHEIIDKIDGRITRTAARFHQVLRVETERDLVERAGLRYHRLFITDHIHPSGQCMDEYMNLVVNLPEDSWIHFHCRSGQGRASTFMVLQDIVRNAGLVSLDDIIRRQALLGSRNMFQVARSKDKMWRRELGMRRRKL